VSTPSSFKISIKICAPVSLIGSFPFKKKSVTGAGAGYGFFVLFDGETMPLPAPVARRK
jgi:hypothetical protein